MFVSPVKVALVPVPDTVPDSIPRFTMSFQVSFTVAVLWVVTLYTVKVKSWARNQLSLRAWPPTVTNWAGT